MDMAEKWHCLPSNATTFMLTVLHILQPLKPQKRLGYCTMHTQKLCDSTGKFCCTLGNTCWFKQLLEGVNPIFWLWSRKVSCSNSICVVRQNSIEALFLRRLQNCVWLFPNKLNGVINAGWSGDHLQSYCLGNCRAEGPDEHARSKQTGLASK